MKKKLVSWVLSSAMALNFAATMPINAFAASGDSRVYEKDGYTVTYSVGSEWDNNQTIEVTIQNTGEESILNWALKYDIDGALSNVWNSKVFCSSEEYTVIKNTGYNYEIEPGQAVKYGYILTSDTDAPAELPEDIELFNRRIDVKSGYETDFNITSDWYTGFQAEISITNTSDEPIEAWTLSFNGNFDINNIWNAKLISSENRNYVTANQLWTTPINPGESSSFGFTADKSATENAAAENFALTAVVIGESSLENAPEEDEPEDINYELNTDEDGLPDYYEEILGTDKNKADTDSDGLNDGYEVFYLGTNPTKADSDDNGIPDGSEDPDNDGLTNIKECELGTDPNNADTDGDGLSDGAEVYTYGTDPLKYDTDDDGISDGDEITLGLDPNNGSTNGTPDSEKSFTQIVSSDSEVLSAINADEETPFKVSLEMKAAGVAENNIYVRESGYSNAIENSAIIGVAPEFVYTDGLAVEEVTVKFELDNSIVSNTLGTYAAENDGFKDIKRLMVFMFFDDVNMLLPVETNYDEVNNVVYTTTDRLGTYCLMDMELFFSNLGIEPSESKIDEEIVTTPVDLLNTEEIADYNSISLNKVELYSNNATNNLIANNHFDVAFIIGEVCYNDVQLEGIKKEVCTISEEIFNNSDDVTISIYGLDGSENTQSTWYGRTDNIDGVKTMLNHVEYKDIKNKYNIVVLSDCIDYVTAAHKSNETLANRDEFCFVYFDPESKTPTGNAMFNYCGVSPRTSDYGLKILELIKKEGTSINFSTITNSYETVEKATNSYANLLFNETSGINVNAISFENVVTESLEHIYGEIPENVNVYKAIIATGYSSVVLDSPLSQQDMDNAEKLIGTLDENNNIVKSNYEFSEEELEDCADSDNDGLWDFEEVMFYLCGNPVISFDDDDNIILPTVANVLGEDKNGAGAYFSAFGFVPYVENGLEKAKEQYDDCYFKFLQYPILPVKSDPNNKDGDEDGIFDNYDDQCLIFNEFPEKFVSYINLQKVQMSQILFDKKEETFICEKSVSDLGLYYDIKPLYYYDEFGCEVGFADTNQSTQVSEGAFDNWYFIAVKDENNYKYSFIYSKDITKVINSFSRSAALNALNKIISTSILPFRTINEYSKEHGIYETIGPVSFGILASAGNNLAETDGTILNQLYGIYRFFKELGSDSDEIVSNTMLTDDYSPDYVKEFLDVVNSKYAEYIDTENEAYKAGMSIGYTFDCVLNAKTIFDGITLIAKGGSVFVGGAFVTEASGGLALSITVPIMVEAGAEIAAGGELVYVSAITFSDNFQSACDTNNKLAEEVRFENIEEKQQRADNRAKRYNEKYNPVERLKEKGYTGIKKTKNGGASFEDSPYIYITEDGKKATVTIKMTGHRASDFTKANEALGIKSKPDGYTWHHLDDYDVATKTCTIELIESDAHTASYPHSGACAQYDEIFGGKYDKYK